MFAKINGTVWNLSAFDCFLAVCGSELTVHRIAFYRNGDECEYEQFDSFENAQKAVDLIYSIHLGGRVSFGKS